MVRPVDVALLALGLLTSYACNEEKAAPSQADTKQVEPSKAAPGPSEPGEDVNVEEGAPLDEEKAAEVVRALARLPEDQKSQFAARALAELERRRLPAQAVDFLEKLPGMSPASRASAYAQLLAEDLRLQFQETCSGDVEEVMKELALAEAGTRAALLWDACELGRLSLMPELQAEKSSGIPMMLAHVLARHLDTQHGGVSEAEKALLLALAQEHAH